MAVPAGDLLQELSEVVDVARHIFLNHQLFVFAQRIDHVDGLYDPASYLHKVRCRAPAAYIVIEKILDLNEDLPPLWPIQGTTGYDFTNYVNELFCQKENE